MKKSQVKLELKNGITVICGVAGQGPRIGYIAGGPGSFYLQGLSCLGDDYTFITCDHIWTYSKKRSFEEKNILSITKEMIKELDHLVIEAVKSHFNVTRIDGFGFSAPGALLFEEAKDYPDDFDMLIGTGVGLIKLDPSFTQTNQFFRSKATRERQYTFEMYQQKYRELAEKKERDFASNKSTLNFFDFKSADKFENKPHKRFIAETIAIIPKILFDYTSEKEAKNIILTHWKKNIFGDYIDKRMQEHFFNIIFPQINSLDNIIDLAKSGKKILLIFGDSDFITPLVSDIEKTIRLYPTIFLEVINNCGHMPYIEDFEQYQNIVMKFVTQNENLVKKDYYLKPS